MEERLNLEECALDPQKHNLKAWTDGLYLERQKQEEANRPGDRDKKDTVESASNNEGEASGKDNDHAGNDDDGGHSVGQDAATHTKKGGKWGAQQESTDTKPTKKLAPTKGASKGGSNRDADVEMQDGAADEADSKGDQDGTDKADSVGKKRKASVHGEENSEASNNANKKKNKSEKTAVKDEYEPSSPTGHNYDDGNQQTKKSKGKSAQDVG